MPVIFSPHGMIRQVSENPCTLLNREICPSHIIKVWEAASDFIIEQLARGRGVRIRHLATITFKIKTIELSHREVIVQKVPHILLAPDLEKRHALKVSRPAYHLDLPEVDLNLSVLACKTKLSRTHVDYCIEEVIAAFNRALMCDPQVEFWFPKIGRVVVQCQNVCVVFLTDFLNLLGFSDEFIQEKVNLLRVR